MKKSGKSRRLNRQSWITAAFKTLVREGIDQVRVERLARKLGTTKGSFYWHFKDRADLLDGILDYWANEMTQTVLDHARMFRGEPLRRIYNTLNEIIGKEKAGFDPQVRAWASNDAKTRRAVGRIDKIRMSFLQGLFMDAGFDEDAAEIRARLIYYYILGEHFTTNKEPMSQRLKKLKRKVDILIQPTAAEKRLKK